MPRVYRPLTDEEKARISELTKLGMRGYMNDDRRAKISAVQTKRRENPADREKTAASGRLAAQQHRDLEREARRDSYLIDRGFAAVVHFDYDELIQIEKDKGVDLDKWLEQQAA